MDDSVSRKLTDRIQSDPSLAERIQLAEPGVTDAVAGVRIGPFAPADMGHILDILAHAFAQGERSKWIVLAKDGHPRVLIVTWSSSAEGFRVEGESKHPRKGAAFAGSEHGTLGKTPADRVERLGPSNGAVSFPHLSGDIRSVFKGTVLDPYVVVAQARDDAPALRWRNSWHASALVPTSIIVEIGADPAAVKPDNVQGALGVDASTPSGGLELAPAGSRDREQTRRALLAVLKRLGVSDSIAVNWSRDFDSVDAQRQAEIADILLQHGAEEHISPRDTATTTFAFSGRSVATPDAVDDLLQEICKALVVLQMKGIAIRLQPVLVGPAAAGETDVTARLLEPHVTPARLCSWVQLADIAPAVKPESLPDIRKATITVDLAEPPRWVRDAPELPWLPLSTGESLATKTLLSADFILRPVNIALSSWIRQELQRTEVKFAPRRARALYRAFRSLACHDTKVPQHDAIPEILDGWVDANTGGWDAVVDSLWDDEDGARAGSARQALNSLLRREQENTGDGQPEGRFRGVMALAATAVLALFLMWLVLSAREAPEATPDPTPPPVAILPPATTTPDARAEVEDVLPVVEAAIPPDGAARFYDAMRAILCREQNVANSPQAMPLIEAAKQYNWDLAGLCMPPHALGGIDVSPYLGPAYSSVREIKAPLGEAWDFLVITDLGPLATPSAPGRVTGEDAAQTFALRAALDAWLDRNILSTAPFIYSGVDRDLVVEEIETQGDCPQNTFGSGDTLYDIRLQGGAPAPSMKILYFDLHGIHSMSACAGGIAPPISPLPGAAAGGSRGVCKMQLEGNEDWLECKPREQPNSGVGPRRVTDFWRCKAPNDGSLQGVACMVVYPYEPVGTRDAMIAILPAGMASGGVYRPSFVSPAGTPREMNTTSAYRLVRLALERPTRMPAQWLDD